jgi:hypothetical protein
MQGEWMARKRVHPSALRETLFLVFVIIATIVAVVCLDLPSYQGVAFA